VLAAHTGTGRSGPDPDCNTHHPSVRPPPRSAANRQALLEPDATVDPHQPHGAVGVRPRSARRAVRDDSAREAR
jgi:hypothetical protein